MKITVQVFGRTLTLATTPVVAPRKVRRPARKARAFYARRRPAGY